MDKKKISIILAVVLAVMAVVMVRNYISQTEKKFVKEEKKAYVLVSTANIPAGTTIDRTMISYEAVPEKYVQPKATNSEAMVIGKRAIADISAGEQIMTNKLTIAVKASSLAMRTPQGKRAFSITLAKISAVDGAIRIGDYVDLIGTFLYNSQIDGKVHSEKVSVTLFQNILVLDIKGTSVPARGQPAQPDGNLVFTLALTPKQISILSYAMEEGTLKLVLRPPLETAIEPIPPVEVNTMWQYVFSNLGQDFINPQQEEQPKTPPVLTQPQQPKKEEPEKAPVLPPTLEIIRGTQKSNIILNN